MKRLFAIFCAAVLLFCGCSVKTVDKEETIEREGERLNEGDAFLLNDYIKQDGVVIQYHGYEDGEHIFTIKNNNRQYVYVPCDVMAADWSFVGIPITASYDLYDESHPEAKIVPPDGMVIQYMTFFSALDPDGDGEYLIAFHVIKTDENGTYDVTPEDFNNLPTYRLKAE